ncbi:MAG: type II toxin-antitoxin system VapC family toxin [Candidatus Eremiobacteraeota bacterium]|nr:type II toxin-antitoxin system VapC family toxin [Candidatus Eremiobacteraeota bacterium]
MIGLDTNVLLRLLTRDDERQHAAAKRFIARNCSPTDPAFINRVVVLECVWVLESFYEYSREQVADAIDGLILVAEFEVEDTPVIRETLEAYRAGADFADAFIACSNADRGCTRTATFDTAAAKRLGHFSAIR